MIKLVPISCMVDTQPIKLTLPPYNFWCLVFLCGFTMECSPTQHNFDSCVATHIIVNCVSGVHPYVQILQTRRPYDTHVIDCALYIFQTISNFLQSSSLMKDTLVNKYATVDFRPGLSFLVIKKDWL